MKRIIMLLTVIFASASAMTNQRAECKKLLKRSKTALNGAIITGLLYPPFAVGWLIHYSILQKRYAQCMNAVLKSKKN